MHLCVNCTNKWNRQWSYVFATSQRDGRKMENTFLYAEYPIVRNIFNLVGFSCIIMHFEITLFQSRLTAYRLNFHSFHLQCFLRWKFFIKLFLYDFIIAYIPTLQQAINIQNWIKYVTISSILEILETSHTMAAELSYFRSTFL